ncbi:actin-related protein 2/3 complex subunit 3-like protein [Neoconidiobolus thromboides FSU 785]|nr:actin-related protein 2/3 complex subunit 3-like protein [Neoconidiobolus thromboides FSU 785]
MPAYHSNFNEEEVQQLGNMSMLPFKTKIRGPILSSNFTSEEEDIVDESFNLFRANCLFKNFEIKGGADRTLIYLTLFISELLNNLPKSASSQNEVQKHLNNIALQSFAIPGDPSFPLNALFSPPKDRHEADLLRQYISQLRQETVLRFLERVYGQETIPSKWWTMFTKRKFMGKSL